MSADLLRRAAEKLREHATSGLRDQGRSIALMHPPVALALADWLDSTYCQLVASHIPIWQDIPGMDDAAIERHLSDSELFGPAVRVARAILREES